MNEPLKRRSLLSALDSTPPELAPAAIAEAAARNGFAPAEEVIPPPLSVSPPTLRRQRQPTGRVHQFNVRLRADTLETIYAQANSRNIPVAQVIEEAIAALLR